MSRVHSDPEALLELAAALREFRTAMAEGEAALRDRLLVELHERWADKRYDEFRENLLRDLDAIRGSNEDFDPLEQRLYALRERLLRYHEEAIARPAVSPSLITEQRAEYQGVWERGAFKLAGSDIKGTIGVASISPPQNEPDFRWEHHGNDKATYMELAATFAEIAPLVRQGRDPAELARQDDRYRKAVDAFWGKSDPIRATRYRDIYLIDSGRHRVAAVLEHGGSALLDVLITRIEPNNRRLTDPLPPSSNGA